MLDHMGFYALKCTVERHKKFSLHFPEYAPTSVLPLVGIFRRLHHRRPSIYYQALLRRKH